MLKTYPHILRRVDIVSQKSSFPHPRNPLSEIMVTKSILVGNLFLVLIMLGLVSSLAFAGSPDTDMALVHTADSQALEWGPCPPFMPEGCAIAVLHGDPAKENLDVFFKVPGNSDIPSHTHTSPERMVLVSGVLHVTYEGQDESVLTVGAYAYGPSQRPHHGRCVSNEPCILFIAFEAPLDAVPFIAPAD